MGHLQASLFAAALLCGALALSPLASEQRAAPRDATPTRSQAFPTPARGLTIRAEGQTLEELLDEFAEVTGEHLIYGAKTASALRASRAQVLVDVEVVPEDVYAVVNNVLSQSRFVLGDVRREEPRLLSVEDLQSREREVAWLPAPFVPIEQLDDYAGDSALMISTIQSTPNIDTRSMGASMRQLVVDPNAMQIVPVPECGHVILTGYSPIVHSTAQLLRRIDEGSARTQERRRAQRAAEASEVDED